MNKVIEIKVNNLTMNFGLVGEYSETCGECGGSSPIAFTTFGDMLEWLESEVGDCPEDTIYLQYNAPQKKRDGDQVF